MIVKCIFSSPKGDIPLGSRELAKPFKTTPLKYHASLTLGDYFDAIKAFLLSEKGKRLIPVLGAKVNQDIPCDNIGEIRIRSEKHGALYHVASAEIFFVKERGETSAARSVGRKRLSPSRHSVKLAISTAVSERGKACLAREWDTVHCLNKALGLPYLPKIYSWGEVESRAGSGDKGFSMLLAEWFEDYHEWHLSRLDLPNSESRPWQAMPSSFSKIPSFTCKEERLGGREKEGPQGIMIWDLAKGHRFASREESFEIYRQASKILTLFYNTHDYRQIYPWHHAAGDFVVRTKDRNVEVKLTTARKYGPVMTFPKEEPVNPLAAIVYFVLNLTLKMRLDKLDGMGDTAWAERLSVEAGIEGFFEALRIMEKKGAYHLGEVGHLCSLLKSFHQDEFYRLYQPLQDVYREEDPQDLIVIEKNLESHASGLYQVMQKFRL
jgi:hypothetical protein